MQYIDFWMFAVRRFTNGGSHQGRICGKDYQEAQGVNGRSKCSPQESIL
jgi:hypothetical protein